MGAQSCVNGSAFGATYYGCADKGVVHFASSPDVNFARYTIWDTFRVFQPQSDFGLETNGWGGESRRWHVLTGDNNVIGS